MNFGIIAAATTIGLFASIGTSSAEEQELPSSRAPAEGHERGRETGLEFGARVGYGIPLGAASGQSGDDLSKSISGMVPIGFDAGYRITPSIHVGGYAVYGLGVVPDDVSSCKRRGVGCSAHDVQLGVGVEYHGAPDETIDPWLGAGIGYELLDLKMFGGGKEASANINGFPLVNLQIGFDLRSVRNFSVGPFASFSIGQYGSASITDTNAQTRSRSLENTALHEWFTLGVRGVIGPLRNP